MTDEEDYTIEQVTQQEYLEVRIEYEKALTEYTDKVLQKGVAQDLVASFLERIGGYVVYYKKETEKEICYDYAIGMPINRADYE